MSYYVAKITEEGDTVVHSFGTKPDVQALRHLLLGRDDTALLEQLPRTRHHNKLCDFEDIYIADSETGKKLQLTFVTFTYAWNRLFYPEYVGRYFRGPVLLVFKETTNTKDDALLRVRKLWYDLLYYAGHDVEAIGEYFKTSIYGDWEVRPSIISHEGDEYSPGIAPARRAGRHQTGKYIKSLD